MTKRVLSLYIRSELVDQLDEYALKAGWNKSSLGKRGGDHKGRDTGRSALFEYILEALFDGRIIVEPYTPNPFPAEKKVFTGIQRDRPDPSEPNPFPAERKR